MIVSQVTIQSVPTVIWSEGRLSKKFDGNWPVRAQKLQLNWTAFGSVSAGNVPKKFHNSKHSTNGSTYILDKE